MKAKPVFPVVFVCFYLFLLAGFSMAGPNPPGSPIAFFPEKKYIFNPVVDGEPIIHDFVLQNKGDETLLIKKVTTD